MTAAAPFDAFLASLDRHIQTTAQGSLTDVSAGPSRFGRPPNALRSVITGDSKAASSSTGSSLEVQISPLERALYYEVETRRRKLRRKQKEIEFWEAHQQDATRSGMPSSMEELEAQIEQKKQRLRQLQGEDNLRTETSKALESSASIQKALSNTSPSSIETRKSDQGAGNESEGRKQYSSTRKLLDARDDLALEFLRVFNEMRTVRQERVQVKAKIREQRMETTRLLGQIKSIKADIRARQLNPTSQTASDSDVSQEVGIAQQIQRLQRRIIESRSKKELVKGVTRGLILESGRDWTKDRETRELLFSLDDEDDASDDAFSEDEENEMKDVDEEEEDEDSAAAEDEDEEIDRLEDGTIA